MLFFPPFFRWNDADSTGFEASQRHLCGHPVAPCVWQPLHRPAVLCPCPGLLSSDVSPRHPTMLDWHSHPEGLSSSLLCINAWIKTASLTTSNWLSSLMRSARRCPMLIIGFTSYVKCAPHACSVFKHHPAYLYLRRHLPEVGWAGIIDGISIGVVSWVVSTPRSPILVI